MAINWSKYGTPTLGYSTQNSPGHPFYVTLRNTETAMMNHLTRPRPARAPRRRVFMRQFNMLNASLSKFENSSPATLRLAPPRRGAVCSNDRRDPGTRVGSIHPFFCLRPLTVIPKLPIYHFPSEQLQLRNPRVEGIRPVKAGDPTGHL